MLRVWASKRTETDQTLPSQSPSLPRNPSICLETLISKENGCSDLQASTKDQQTEGRVRRNKKGRRGRKGYCTPQPCQLPDPHTLLPGQVLTVT